MEPAAPVVPAIMIYKRTAKVITILNFVSTHDVYIYLNNNINI